MRGPLVFTVVMAFCLYGFHSSAVAQAKNFTFSQLLGHPAQLNFISFAREAKRAGFRVIAQRGDYLESWTLVVFDRENNVVATATSRSLLKAAPMARSSKDFGQGFQSCIDTVSGHGIPVLFAPNGGVDGLHGTKEHPEEINLTFDEKFAEKFVNQSSKNHPEISGGDFGAALNHPTEGLNQLISGTNAPHFVVNKTVPSDSSYTQVLVRCGGNKASRDYAESVVYQAMGKDFNPNDERKKKDWPDQSRFAGVLDVDCSGLSELSPEKRQVVIRHELLHQYGLDDNNQDSGDIMYYFFAGDFSKRKFSEADRIVLNHIYSASGPVAGALDCEPWCHRFHSVGSCKSGVDLKALETPDGIESLLKNKSESTTK